MSTTSKAAKSLLVSASLLALTPAAFAGDPGELEARIQALEAMVAELKGELADQKAQTDSELIKLKNTAKSRKMKGGSGNDKSITWGGFIDFDAHVTDFADGDIGSSSIARDFYIPGAIPVGGTSEEVSTDFTAQASRFWVAAKQDVGDHKLGARIEMDFLGSAQGNERVSNSYSPRLRRAYVTFDNWLIGQEWSTFQNTSSIPESASFLALSDGMVFERQPQIRYTNGNWQFALENGNTTVTSGGGRVESDDNLMPDLVARYNHKGDFGNISVSAIARQLRAEFGTVDEDAFGWGLSVAGRVKVNEGGDDIRFSVTGGEGIGRYIGLNAANAATLDIDGSLDPIPSYGGLIAYRHVNENGSRFNFGYSGLFLDNDDAVTGNPVESVQSVYGAYLWDVAPKVTMGAELMYGLRELQSGADGDMTRFTFSTKYAF